MITTPTSIKITVLGFLATSLALAGTVIDTLHERWDWTDIDTKEHIPAKIAHTLKSSGFVFGAASAEYQILGQLGLPASQMAYGEVRMKQTATSGYACGGFDQHFKDIELLEQCGLSSYRFSIDWSALEPFPGDWNDEVLQHYVDFCAALKAKNIKVMVTLHHFVHPQWFEVMGAFEKEENIAHFVRFCEKVFNSLAPYVDWWCTINEPGIYMFQSYVRGVFPPFRSVVLPGMPLIGFREGWAPLENARYSNIKLAGTVLRNLLRAHVAVYETLKNRAHACRELDGWNFDPQIGFVHQYLTFSSFHNPALRVLSPINGLLGTIEAKVGDIINNWINWSVMNFFEHGEFSFLGAADLNESLPAATSSFDFVGLNYYSVVFFDVLKAGPGYYAGDIPTKMPYGIYAEGLYAAIRHCSRLKKPIYITENGVDDREDDTTRSVWIRRHLAAVAEAVHHGYDVRGFFYWCLLDNWEWDMGYGPKFGLYAVDFKDPLLPRRLKKGSEAYRDIAILCLPEPKVS